MSAEARLKQMVPYPRRGTVFLDAGLPPGQRPAQFEALRRLHPDIFPTNQSAARYLNRIHMPASMRWAFMNNGKAGTSSARRVLFQLEFGVPLTARRVVPQDLNSDAAVHHMQGATGILRTPALIPDAITQLDAALRITIVRHPTDRALSAFEYICHSNDLGHDCFAEDRLRMNALVGFDWNRHPGTAEGLGRFLEYTVYIRDEAGAMAINSHWRPQVENIRPAVFRPDLIGRLEDMAGFYRALSERLGQPAPDNAGSVRSNSQTYRSDRSSLLTPDNRIAIGKIYAADFEWLGYNPEDRP